MGKKLYVGNLPHQVSESHLQPLFREYGLVVSAQVIIDQDTGRSKGFGFVEMGCEEDARAAIKGLNGAELNGRPLTVNKAKPRTE